MWYEEDRFGTDESYILRVLRNTNKDYYISLYNNIRAGVYEIRCCRNTTSEYFLIHHDESKHSVIDVFDSICKKLDVLKV